MPRKQQQVPWEEERLLGPGIVGRPWQETSSCVPLPDGVVLVDPDYLKDRKGTGQVEGAWGGGVRWH